MRRSAFVVASLLFLSALGGCGSSPSGGASDEGGADSALDAIVEVSPEGSAEGAADSGVDAVEASADGTAPEEAGSHPSIDAGTDAGTGDGGLSCPDTASLTSLTPTIVHGDLPAFTGGTIQDAEYVATSIAYYDPNGVYQTACSGTPGPSNDRGAFAFYAGTLRSVLDKQGGGNFCSVGPYTVSGSGIDLLGRDGGTAGTIQYSVSSDGLTLYVRNWPAGSLSCSSDGGGPPVVFDSVGTFARQ